MYKSLENYYRENSTEIKFRKMFTVIYFAFATVALIMNLIIPGNWLAKICIISFIFLLTVTLCVEISAFITSRKIIIRRDDLKTLFQNFATKDLSMVRNYFKNHLHFDKKTLEVVMNHYLRKSQKSNSSGTLLTILLAIATALTSSIHDNSFDIAYFTITMIIVSIFLLVYYVIRSSQDAIKFYTGKDDLYETLEEITTELYLEATHNSKIKCIH